MTEYRIGVINFGSTSTKVACYESERMLFVENIKHAAAELAQFKEVFDQLEYRYEKIIVPRWRRLAEGKYPQPLHSIRRDVQSQGVSRAVS